MKKSLTKEEIEKLESNQLRDFYIPHDPVKLFTGEKTIVEQHHEETTNINKIVARYRRSGQMPEHREGTYADVSNVGELLDTKMQFDQVEEIFENLPQVIKDQFKDSQEFLEYVDRMEQVVLEPIQEPEGDEKPAKEPEKPENPPPEGE